MFRVILIALLIYTGWQAQVLLPGAPTLAWGATLLLFWLMVGWQMTYRRHADAVETRWFHGLAWIGSACFGVWASFVLFSLPVDLAVVVARLAGRSSDFMREALQVALAAAVLTTAVGLWQALRGPVLKCVTIPVVGLHQDIAGLTIVQISDLHVGPTIRRRYVERVVKKAMAAQPDLVAITGDLVDGHPQRLWDELAPLAKLAAPLGVYYVTGNHEYYWGGEAWIAAVSKLGCTPLIDRNVVLNRGRAQLLVAGVADVTARHFGNPHAGSVRRAAATDVDTDFRMLLAHRPGLCRGAAAAGFDLQLSGHTHGGQFFPFNLIVRLTHRYHRGLVRLGSLWLYVSAGTGYWGPPHRFWIPAEIAVLRLKRTEADEREPRRKRVRRKKTFPEEFSSTA